ncbi:MAG: hypothetical protein ACYCQM_07875 [Acidithiobacillus sp.]
MKNSSEIGAVLTGIDTQFLYEPVDDCAALRQWLGVLLVIDSPVANESRYSLNSWGGYSYVGQQGNESALLFLQATAHPPAHLSAVADILCQPYRRVLANHNVLHMAARDFDFLIRVLSFLNWCIGLFCWATTTLASNKCLRTAPVTLASLRIDSLHHPESRDRNSWIISIS